MISFATIDANLPEELADRIARIAHKNAFGHVLAELQYTTMSILDKAIECGAKNIVNYVRQNTVPGTVDVKIDDQMDWYTILILMDKMRFILYHHYSAYFIIEGRFNDEKQIEIDYLHAIDDDGNECHDYDDLSLIMDVDWISATYKSYKEWKHPYEIINAFRLLKNAKRRGFWT